MGWVKDALNPIGAVAGAAIGAIGQHQATKAQEKSNAAALAFQREQEASRKTAFDAGMKQYEAKWNAWNASRNALLQRYGIDIGSSQPPTTSGLMGGQQAPPGAVPRAPQAPPMGPRGPISVTPPQQAQSVAGLMGPGGDASQWNDWRAQGLSQ